MTELLRVPMVCSCGADRDAEGHCLLDEVKTRLSQETENLMAHEVTDANLLTSIVVSLHWDYDARITGIRTDQWSRVTAETHDGELVVAVECDRVEHGIAALWKAFADRFSPGPPK